MEDITNIEQECILLNQMTRKIDMVTLSLFVVSIFFRRKIMGRRIVFEKEHLDLYKKKDDEVTNLRNALQEIVEYEEDRKCYGEDYYQEYCDLKRIARDALNNSTEK